MNNIKDYLDYCSKQYYSGTPVITDQVFDALANLHNYSAVGAAAQQAEPHLWPMYSLQKHYEDENKPNPLHNQGEVGYSIKLDGAAISLLYVDGMLVKALTRGDGKCGQNITEKLLSSQHLVPHKIELKGVHQVTGEIVAPKHIANSRNYAAGALNLKDCEEFKTRALSFFAYDVFPRLTTTHSGDMQQLKNLGFSTVKEIELDKIYPSDGLVFRLEDHKLFDQLGYTSHHPRGAYAYKTRPPHVETKILDVEWQVGKTGKVTPVAILEPVMIGDAVVSRATLNNPGFIEQLGIEIGDTVAVVRAGEIIPCIVHKVNV